MTTKHDAWLLPIADGRQCAVTKKEIVEYILTPQLMAVPFTPPHCGFLLNWRNQTIPVVNLAMLLKVSDPYLRSQHVAIVAYQSAPQTALKYGAIMLTHAPYKIAVGDEQACRLPNYVDKYLSLLVLSSFKCDQETTPILDLSYLFSSQLVNYPQHGNLYTELADFV